MKPIKPFLLILFSCYLFLVSCTQNKSQITDTDKYDQKVNLYQNPNTIKLSHDSLIVNIPGSGKNERVKIINKKLPEKTAFSLLNKIIPGESYLPISLKQKLEGVKPTKSKLPLITKVDKKLINSRINKKPDSATIIKLGKQYTISKDSIQFFQQIIKNENLYSIQHNDTIFPPLTVYSEIMELTDAKALRYRDDAVFDISYLGGDQGLPNSYIRSIKKDNQGVLWLATHTGGLISYDGRFYRHYTKKSGLSDNQIISFVIDHENNFWLGTISGGLNYFDGNKFVHYTKEQGLPSNMILSLEVDKLGRIWIGTSKGLVCFDGKKFKVYTTKQGLSGNAILSLKSDRQGNLWIGVYGHGLAKWDGDKFINYNSTDGLASNMVYAIHQDFNEDIWLGTQGGGVSKFNGKSFVNYNKDNGLIANDVLAISDSPDSSVCFGTFGEGLVVFDGEGFINYNSEEGLNDAYIRSLFKDEIGNLWIGTDGGGLIKYNPDGFTNITKQQGLPDNLIVSAIQDNNKGFWFAAFNEGVIYMKESPQIAGQSDYVQITTKQGLVNNTVTSILQDTKGDIWLGTYGGGISKLSGADLKRNKIKLINISTEQGLLSNVIRDLIEDSEGNIWIATDYGLSKYKDNIIETFTTKSGLPINKTSCLFQDNNNAIWVGTDGGGLSKIENDSITTYGLKQGLISKSVWAIKQDKNNIIWIGTEGGGLCYFNGKSFHIINEESGLCDNDVFSLTINDEDLWVGTTNGLSQIILNKLNKSDKPEGDYYDKAKIFNYGREEGLKSLDFYHKSAFIDDNQRLWLGSVKALSVIDITKLKKPSTSPKTYLERIIINGNKIDFGELKANRNKYLNQGIHFNKLSPFASNPIGLSLPYHMNQLTFNYCATDWMAPDKIKYQFILEGYDKEWNKETSSNLVDYKNLSPGDYNFKLRAKGISNIWSDTIEYKFQIRNPWWFSWGAFIFYLLAFIAFIWFIINWRVSIIKKQKIILERLVEKRTKDLNKALILADQAAVAKSQFVANMSHEIRTPLTAILGLTNLAFDENKDSKVNTYLTKIHGSASNMLLLINDLLDFSKIEAGKLQFEKVSFKLQDILSNMLVINSKLLQEKDIELVFIISPEVPENMIGDPIRIGQVLSNLVNNAIKFTEKGQVIVDICVLQTLTNEVVELQVTVKDTGVGIEDQHIKYIFNEFEQADNSITRKYGGSGLGLAICKSLVDLMDGKLWVESKVNEGSSFYFSVKLQKDTSVGGVIAPHEIWDISLIIFDNNEKRANNISKLLEYYSLKSDCVYDEKTLFDKINSLKNTVLIIDGEVVNDVSVNFFQKLQNAKKENVIRVLLISNSELSSNNIISTYPFIDDAIIKPLLPVNILNKLLAFFTKPKVEISKPKIADIDYNLIKSKVKGKNILVVEDNEIVSDLISELLNKVGLNVSIVTNGALAVDIVEEQIFDLIFMDMHMPVMDGFSASKNIRNKKIKTPIILLTADTKDSLAEECDKIGINDLITKPIDIGLFYQVLLKSIVNNRENDNSLVSDIVSINTEPDIEFQNLDTESAIRRFAGNKKLFIKILHKFMNSNKNICDEIKLSVSNNDFKTAYIKCHSLKGESSNISAYDVFRKAEILENSITEEYFAGIEKNITELEKSLQKLLEELHSYFESVSKESRVKEDINKILKDIVESLKIRDPKVFDLLDELVNYQIDKEVIAKLDNAVSTAQNEKALEILNSLIKKFNQ